MRLPRIQFTLTTFGVVFTVSTIVVWWWYPGTGARGRGIWSRGQVWYPKVERLTTVDDFVFYQLPESTKARVKRCKGRAKLDARSGATPPQEPPTDVDFEKEDVLVILHLMDSEVFPTHARLGGQLVIICGEHPGKKRYRGCDQVQEVVISKNATVVFWPGNTLGILDLTVWMGAVVIFLLLLVGHLHRRETSITVP